MTIIQNEKGSKNNKILFISPHIETAFGVRYLSRHLLENGFEPTICSVHKWPKSPNLPKIITDKEIELLKEFVQKEKYLFIGISILSSYALSEVYRINDMLKNVLSVPVVWGGVCPSLLPEKCAKHCDIVIKGEGEIPIVQLANAFQNGTDWKKIPGICFYDEHGQYIENEVAPLIENLDEIGYPLLSSDNIYNIDNDNITKEDELLKTDYYEIAASRGCFFSCAYCSSSKIRNIYKGKGKYARIRSVDNVIGELKEAKKKNPNIKEIRFWDEIFIVDKNWLKEFSEKYKKEIDLPFTIWAHPYLVSHDTIKPLYDAGLRRISLGFQSGSPNVRNNIFKRPESNEKIIEASRILTSYKGLEIYYDLIICHVLETIGELKETFDLCLKLKQPFGLQIRGLSYLPKTDIIETIIDRSIYTKEEMEEIFDSPFEKHFIQWNGPSADYYQDEPKKIVWADLIYLTQFIKLRKKVVKLSRHPYTNYQKIKALKNKMEQLSYEEREYAKLHITGLRDIIDKIRNIFHRYSKGT